LRRAMADLFEKLPEALRNGPEAQLLRPAADHKVYNIVQLIYHAKNYEGHSKDYEFSRASMQEHWRAGHHDAVRTLRHPEVLQRPINDEVSSRSISTVTVANRDETPAKGRRSMTIQSLLGPKSAEVFTIRTTETVKSADRRLA
jgi:Patatin phospholipase